jgi:uncharacterized protein YlzI (FlbEa/FlbD family)
MKRMIKLTRAEDDKEFYLNADRIYSLEATRGTGAMITCVFGDQERMLAVKEKPQTVAFRANIGASARS